MGAVFPLVRLLPAGMGVGLAPTSSTTGPPPPKPEVVASNTPESLLLWLGYSLYWGVVLLGHDVPVRPGSELARKKGVSNISRG